jgi:hypothetical protein
LTCFYEAFSQAILLSNFQLLTVNDLTVAIYIDTTRNLFYLFDSSFVRYQPPPPPEIPNVKAQQQSTIKININKRFNSARKITTQKDYKNTKLERYFLVNTHCS